MVVFANSRRNRIAVGAVACAAALAMGSASLAEITLPGFRKSEPVDPFESRAGMTPPIERPNPSAAVNPAPNSNNAPRNSGNRANSEGTYIAQRDVPRRDPAVRDPAYYEAANRDSMPRDSMSRDSLPRDTFPRDGGPRETVARYEAPRAPQREFVSENEGDGDNLPPRDYSNRNYAEDDLIPSPPPTDDPPVEERHPPINAAPPRNTAAADPRAAQPSAIQPASGQTTTGQAPAGDKRGLMAIEEPDPLQLALPIASVGPEIIVLGDVIGPVNQQFYSLVQSGAISQANAERERNKLIKEAINAVIEQKLIILVARRDLPPEALPKIEKSVNEQYDKTQLKDMYAKTKTSTKAELDAYLRMAGSSLARQRKQFFEKSMTQEWIRREINYDPEVTYDDMLAYYREHRADFTSKPKVQWEELMVSFDAFATKRDAYRAIAEMGNDVFSNKASFAEVAKKRSQGATAQSGGARDWTTKGSLACEELDQAIFTLPVGQMSRIIESSAGFHIARVTQRQEAVTQPFTQAQTEIKEKVRKQRVDVQVKKYIAGLRDSTPIWTMFDGPRPETATANARPDATPPR